MSDGASGASSNEASGTRRSIRRYLVLVVLVAGGLLAVSLARGCDGDGATGQRVSGYVLSGPELGRVLGVSATALRRTNPPVDIGQVERSARSLTMGQVPLPDDRSMATVRRSDTGHEITQLVMLYDDAAALEGLDELAASLVGGAFHLESEPVALADAVDARRWWAASFRALSFRKGKLAVFLGTSDEAGEDDLRAIAATIIARIEAHPPPPPSATATS